MASIFSSSVAIISKFRNLQFQLLAFYRWSRSNEINLYLSRVTRVNFLETARIRQRVEGSERGCRHDTVINCASFAQLPHPWINFNDSGARAGNVATERWDIYDGWQKGGYTDFAFRKMGKAMSLDLFHLGLDNNEL